MANILVLGAKVPFTSGGQEALVRSLAKELARREHQVEIVELPYNPLPKESLLTQAAVWRSMNLQEFAGTKIDLVIATKFPTYYAKHPCKSLWLVHQHRAMYELYGTRYSDFSDDVRDEELRKMLLEGDRVVLTEAAYHSGISNNVTERLKRFNGIDAETLYPPLPLGNRYHKADSQPYVLSVGRICSIKRVDLIVKAMPFIPAEYALHIVGTPDEPAIMDYLESEIAKHDLQSRVRFLGRVSDEELLAEYANASVVYYAPKDEDYGYVTLEAFASSKPVVTAHDSGGVLEFVEHESNGLVVDPSEQAIGEACSKLLSDAALRERYGTAGRTLIDSLGMTQGSWELVCERLCSPLGVSLENRVV